MTGPAVPLPPEAWAFAERLRTARHVAALTGAGVSAESGIPTFREALTGLWARYRPEDLATPGAFARHPEVVWQWYAWRRKIVQRASPNAGHRALARLERLVPRFTLVTQNVDGLHQRAGSTGVIEFHGNLFQDRCFVEGSVVEQADTSVEVPLCPGCGGMLRPGVVWFGEAIPESALHAAASAVSACDLFFSIGTSALVWPAAGLADAARQQGAIVVEINLDETPLSTRTDFCLNGKSGSILPELVDCLSVQ